MTGGHGRRPRYWRYGMRLKHGLVAFMSISVTGCVPERFRTTMTPWCFTGSKVCASGGCTSQLDDPEHQQFSDSELKAIVEEAARSDRIVAAHCHGKTGIMAALRAGCKTIEHGT